MSTFMGLPDAEYFFHHPKPMPAHPTLGVIEPGTGVQANYEGNTITGRVRYPDEDDIPCAEPESFGLANNKKNRRRIMEEPWVVIAIKHQDGSEEEPSVFLKDVTKVL